jgi:hypothetical protein
MILIRIVFNYECALDIYSVNEFIVYEFVCKYIYVCLKKLKMNNIDFQKATPPIFG